MSPPVALAEECCVLEFSLMFSKNPDPRGESRARRLRRLQHRWRWLAAALQQGQLGAGFPESGFSVTKRAEWLSMPLLRQCCNFLPPLVGWAIVRVCLGLRSFSKCRTLSANNSEANWGSWSPSLPAPPACAFSLASSHCPKHSAHPQLLSLQLQINSAHGGAGAWQNKV